MSEIGKPIREWEVEEPAVIPAKPQQEEQPEREQPAVPEHPQRKPNKQPVSFEYSNTALMVKPEGGDA